jgi:ATP-dependent helicase/nuclease subunit A
VSAAEVLRDADARARARAQHEFAAPLAIEAGAGTGKTAVLVARVVAWCVGPGWERAAERLRAAPRAQIAPPDTDDVAREVLRGVVAITFTEAAAAEMEGRIALAFRAVAAGATPIGVDEAALPQGAAARAERAGALAVHRDQLSVRTIHAFCRRLLAAHPLEAGLHPRFEIDAQERLSARAAREALEARLREAFGEPGAPEFLDLADEGFGPADVEEALVELVRTGAPATLLDLDPFAPERIAAVHASLAAAVAGFVDAGGDRLAAVTGAKRVKSAAEAVVTTRALLADPVPKGVDALDVWLDALREVWEDPDDLKRIDKFARGDFTAKGDAALGPAADVVASASVPLRAILRHVVCLRARRLERLRGVLAPLLHATHDRLRRRGVVGFAALLRETRDLLARHPAVAAAVRGEIDQLLVDEFQDTDATQCEILASLALAGPQDARPGLFLVGDPKQSIYGWRNADLAAYEGFLASVVGAGGSVERLTVNFRSVPAVLDEVSAVIQPAMRERAGLQPRFETLLACPRLAEAPGFRAAGRRPVEHWISWGWDAGTREADPALTARRAAELEARAVARDLRELHDAEGVPYEEMALLFRSTGDFEVYLSALRELAVPFVVERDTTFYARREIVDALAWVCCILDPLDHLSLVAALRSSAVGVPDGALIPLWRAGFPDRIGRVGPADAEGTALAEVQAAIASAVAAVPEALPGIARVAGWEASLAAFADEVAALRISFERDSAARFVERLRTGLAVDAGEAARHLGAWRLANLDRFFRGLAEALEETGGDRAAVLSHLRRAVTDEREHEEGRPREAAENAVHVTTIHKAKGLDFDHVYILQLHKDARRDPPQETRAAPLRAGRAPEYKLCGVPSPGYHAASAERAEVELHERVRLLYVAMTRARQRLVLVGKAPRAPADPARTLADLWMARSPEPPPLAELVCDLGASGVDAADAEVLWRFPALAPEAPPPPGVPRAAETADLDRIADEEAALRLGAQRALARAARPFHAVASEELSDADARLETRYGPDGGERAPARDAAARAVALAAGTAVHAALETFDPAEEPAAARARFLDGVRSALSLEIGPGDRPEAEARALAVYDRFAGGSLHRRLRKIAPAIVARELPLLLAPDPDAGLGPVGFWSGAIDLLYWDAAAAEYVVADYKTDAVTPSEAPARAASYARQGWVYTGAIQGALGLAARPRFELWFLAAGVVVPIGPPEGPAAPVPNPR